MLINFFKKTYYWGLSFLLIPTQLWAEEHTAEKHGVGLGQISRNVLEPVSVFADFLHTACLVIGAAFIFTSIIKYFEHRRSPLMVTMTTVLFLFIAGLILLLLPLIPLITKNGISSPY